MKCPKIGQKVVQKMGKDVIARRMGKTLPGKRARRCPENGQNKKQKGESKNGEETRMCLRTGFNGI